MSDERVKVRNDSATRVLVAGKSFEPGEAGTVRRSADAERPDALDELLESGAFAYADVTRDEVLEEMTGPQVDSELERRGLPKSGTVPERRERLRDAEANPTPAAPSDEQKGGDRG